MSRVPYCNAMLSSTCCFHLFVSKRSELFKVLMCKLSPVTIILHKVRKLCVNPYIHTFKHKMGQLSLTMAVSSSESGDFSICK